jgi:16S rRNA (cytosine1402-N4)-methyltransferase
MHIPVLCDEVVALLKWDSPGMIVADLTLGQAGHLKALLAASPKPQKIVGVDQDPEAIARCRAVLCDDSVEFYQMNFSTFLSETPLQFDRILIDLGVSSFQLDEASRGFSFRRDGPLDMRMNPNQGEPVWLWLEHCSETEFAEVIWRYGEDRQSRLWARRWVQSRKNRSIQTTREFVEALGLKLESKDRRGHHPLTRVFQALRIFINDEMGHLKRALEILPSKLRKNGRLGIISFHSLEDREVKWSLRGKLKALNKKVIQGSEAEKLRNPRSRSAKLRVFLNDGEEENHFR